MEKFYLKPEEFKAKNPESEPCTEYECMECGCKFYGKWHSEYSMNKVVCPVCKDNTDPFL